MIQFLTVLTIASLFFTNLLPPSWAQEPKTAGKFQITGVVVGQSYCLTRDDTFALGGKVRLRLTNRSDGNLIVPRNFSAPPNQFYIAVDGDALSEGHFEYRSRDDWTVDTGPSKSGPELLGKGPSLQEVQTADQLETTTNSGTKAPGSQFIVLRPGEYTESTLDFGVAGLALSANRRTFGTGRHVIQYRIQSWTVFDPQVKAEEHKQRWSQFGALIYGPLETEAIPFDIPADPKSSARGKC